MRNVGTLKVTTPTDREIVLTRVFDAPRRPVFDAFSKPELLKRWFGPRGWSLVVCEVELKVGGGFRFVLRGPDGREMGMRGVYREIVPPERSVHIESTIRVSRRLPRYSSSRKARQRSPPRCSTPRKRFATPSSDPGWSMARRRATTSWRSCWPRGLDGLGMSPSQRLDAAFAALADPTRRAILARLASGEASVAELSKPFAISGGRDAQRRPRRLEVKPLAEATGTLKTVTKDWFALVDTLTGGTAAKTQARKTASVK